MQMEGEGILGIKDHFIHETAHDHYISSTLVGGKDGASLSSLCTTLEGPTEHVNARWKERAFLELRATSHMRLRARDHFTSSTLLGGKGGAGASSLHTTHLRDQRSEYVNARWM